MTLFWIILLAAVIGILAAEWILWQLFHRRVEGLHLHLSSTTGRRVFTVMRLRVCVVFHTILLVCSVILSLFFVW